MNVAFRAQLEAFAVRLEAEQRTTAAANLERLGIRYVEGLGGEEYLIESQSKVSVRYRRRYVVVDVGTSGRYMIPSLPAVDAGTIYGIKGYVGVSRGRAYGTLATIGDWTWGGTPRYVTPG